MKRLALNFLGTFQAAIAGRLVPLKRNKGRALLAYLAVEAQRPHERAALAGLLWPEMPQRSALRNLTNTLSQLNRALDNAGADPTSLLANHRTIQFNASSQYSLDVTDFQRPLQSDDANKLEQGVALYQGEFLPGFSLPDCLAFDEWLLQTREQLHNQALSALHRLADHFLESGDFAKAQHYAQRQLELDILREAAHGQLMQALALGGQRAAALAQYEKCRQILTDELGVSPGSELSALYEQIREGSDEFTRRRDSDIHAVTSFPSMPSHNLPPQPTPFVGRETELAEIATLLREPDCRLLTLVGQGGMGKTRLAIELASQLAADFTHGVGYVPLASLASIDLLPNTIAQELNLPVGGSDDNEQVLRQLQRREMLLVLDNYEHLRASDPDDTDANMLTGAGFVGEILARAAHVKILVTSRERLRLQQEWLYAVEGLAYPRRQPVDDPTAYDAIVLFSERMMRVQPNFSYAQESESILEICRLVGGMPLGLELAASWGRLMSCREIAQEIKRGLDFLETTLRNVPARHRSIRAVLEYSWQLLTGEEQGALARLSILRDGFTRAAATHVTDASLGVLLSLVDKSLLQRRQQDGRYEMHELLRQFAAEKLEDMPDEPERTQQAHAAYYADFLQQREPDLKGKRVQIALDEVAAEIDNVRLAWRWAVTRRNLSFFQQAYFSMWLFRQFWGSEREAERAYRQAAAAFRPQSDTERPPVAQQIILGQLLIGQSYCLARLHRLEQSHQCLQEALAILRQVGPDGRWPLALALVFGNWLTLMRGQLRLAAQAAQESLDIFTELGDAWGKGVSSWFLGLVYERAGAYNEAEAALQAGIATLKSNGERCYLGHATSTLSRIAVARGRYGDAELYLRQSKNLLRGLDNIKDQGFTTPSAGLMALESGDLTRAEELFQESLQIAEEYGERGAIFYCRNGLGYVARLRRDFKQAEKLHHACLDASRKVGWRWGVSLSLFHLGCLALDRGELDQAKQLCQESLDIAREMSIRQVMVRCWLRLGYVTCARGETAEAKQWLHKALAYGIEQQLPPVMLGALAGVAMLPDGVVQPEKAVELLALAEHHPAKAYETGQIAKRLLAELRVELPLETMVMAEECGRRLDWQTTAQTWLEQLPALDGQDIE